MIKILNNSELNLIYYIKNKNLNYYIFIYNNNFLITKY